MAQSGTGVKIPDEDPEEETPQSLDGKAPEESEAPKVDEEEAPAEPVPAFDWNSKWRPTPAVANQYREYPKTVKVGPPIMAAYHLSEPLQLVELNKILAMSVPKGSPSVTIVSLDTKFSDKSGFVTALLYSELSYKQIIQPE